MDVPSMEGLGVTRGAGLEPCLTASGRTSLVLCILLLCRGSVPDPHALEKDVLGIAVRPGRCAGEPPASYGWTNSAYTPAASMMVTKAAMSVRRILGEMNPKNLNSFAGKTLWQLGHRTLVSRSCSEPSRRRPLTLRWAQASAAGNNDPHLGHCSSVMCCDA